MLLGRLLSRSDMMLVGGGRYCGCLDSNLLPSVGKQIRDTNPGDELILCKRMCCDAFPFWEKWRGNRKMYGWYMFGPKIDGVCPDAVQQTQKLNKVYL
jgi:hypothetical protein